MPIYNLFSKRQKAERESVNDILHYDELPKPLRIQLIHIITDVLDEGAYKWTDVECYFFVRDILIREYGLFRLNDSYSVRDEVTNFILMEKDVERVLDAIELCIKFIDKIIRQAEMDLRSHRKLAPDNAIEDLNQRFKEHAIGYRYESTQLLRIDSTYIHSEIVKPTLVLLNHKLFKGANEEYLKAHEHYRHGRNKECLTDCLKAFESVMKIIITAKGWKVDAKATSSGLIKVCFDNGLIPSYLQTQMTSLRSALESGVPTIRNRIGGHGQGASQIIADDLTTRFTLNLTGSCIIYLIELSGI